MEDIQVHLAFTEGRIRCIIKQKVPAGKGRSAFICLSGSQHVLGRALACPSQASSALYVEGLYGHGEGRGLPGPSGLPF